MLKFFNNQVSVKICSCQYTTLSQLMKGSHRLSSPFAIFPFPPSIFWFSISIVGGSLRFIFLLFIFITRSFFTRSLFSFLFLSFSPFWVFRRSWWRFRAFGLWTSPISSMSFDPWNVVLNSCINSFTMFSNIYTGVWQTNKR